MKPWRVTGLVAGSAAATAGLREGDRITGYTGVRARIAHSAQNIVIDPRITVLIDRGGPTLTVAYSTEGAMIREYRWSPSRKAGTGCALPA